ncbi:hypothetical protein [Longitalea arenae]|uniref:hypothetical protein n=1 Tax=Longitalea arenae TaxID=2812558 RepID=UPI001967770C|nr:hypothetical protein [Longitalea arenae]
MKIFTLVAVLLGSMITHLVMAQESWPKTATTSDGAIIKLYQWQPDSFANNNLKAHAAISVLESGKSEPVFGVAWLKATTATTGAQVQVQSMYITNIKLPGENSDDKLEEIANTMEEKVSSWNISFPLSDLQQSLELNKQQTALASQINNTPPKVIYTNVPSILVSIDGTPKLQTNKEWGVEAVVNTPFVLVKNRDDRFYLYGGKHWYTAPAATGPYKLITNIPSNLGKIESAIKEADKKNPAEGKETDDNTIYNIVVTTEPAELIQSKGEANFAPLPQTGLLYVSNSENDIFMDINSQQYYVLLSGRWYRSKTLSGNWEYVAADQLPADFAKIPKGSPKDNVLASVAGTEEANDAIADAQVPQTAKVERNKVRADVEYDGDPAWEAIEGTDMYYATNSPVSVIRWRGRYYSVDNGIWFESGNAVGPWTVCINRPYAVALIPPRYPVYYMKYVYIYDVTPDYVYMGYTPGYLNAYVYGPTVVYGTGYYYRPWYGHYYYPRPYTWGFGIRYNPWFGWGFGVGFGYDWFNVSIGFGNPWGYWGYGGWWGPRVYRPCYYGPSYHYRGGYYGYNSYRSYRQYNNVTVVNNYYVNNNIYRNRSGIVTRNNPRSYEPYRNSRYGGNRSDFANNRRFGNDNRGGDRDQRFDFNRRSTDQQRNGAFDRDRFSNPENRVNRNWSRTDDNNRTWNRPDNNSRTTTQPQQNIRERFNSQSFGTRDRDNDNVRPRQYNRAEQLENRQPRSFEPRNFDQNRSMPQRSYEPSSGNRGNFGGNRGFEPRSRPSMPQGNMSMPRGNGGGERGAGPRSFSGGNSGGGERGAGPRSFSGGNNGGGRGSFGGGRPERGN